MNRFPSESVSKFRFLRIISFSLCGSLGTKCCVNILMSAALVSLAFTVTIGFPW